MTTGRPGSPARKDGEDVTDGEWVQDGVTPHPTGGYTYVNRGGGSVFYSDSAGQEHRLDGPAVEMANGYRQWRVHGKRHRVDGPAVDLSNGYWAWFFEGSIHRVNGPAARHPDGRLEWFVNGKRHRIDGPAVEYANGKVAYFLCGQELTEAEHAEGVARLQETGEAPEV